MKKKKAVYLSLIIILLLSFTAYLFYQKSILLRSEIVASELQKSLLAYIEKEEAYPEKLAQVKFDNRDLKVIYERLEDGRGCRFIIEGKVYELWDEER